MNERIKELAEQAAEQVIGIEPEAIMVTETDTDHIEVPSTFILTFAELIIRECACIADDMKTLETSQAIKEHFGVE